MKSEIIKRVVEKAGGVTPLARHLGIRMESIYSWTQIPAKRVVEVERITGIPREELRPDVFAPAAAEGERA
jgi:DNA-binding transcriptional regulator YdaS (Cro superfamily)